MIDKAYCKCLNTIYNSHKFVNKISIFFNFLNRITKETCTYKAFAGKLFRKCFLFLVIQNLHIITCYFWLICKHFKRPDLAVDHSSTQEKLVIPTVFIFGPWPLKFGGCGNRKSYPLC